MFETDDDDEELELISWCFTIATFASITLTPAYSQDRFLRFSSHILEILT